MAVVWSCVEIVANDEIFGGVVLPTHTDNSVESVVSIVFDTDTHSDTRM